MASQNPAIHWTTLAARLNAIAQNGLAFTKDAFDKERFENVRQIAAEIVAAEVGAAAEEVESLLREQVGYATPKVDIRCAVFQEGKILLVRERSDQKWTLPGGWGDVGESLKETAVKEVREESGFEVLPRKLIAVYDRNKHPHVPRYVNHIYKCFVLCEIVSGEAAEATLETDSIQFFSEDDLPPLSLARVTAEQVQCCFKHHRDPSLPTEFD